jgi:TRAP-type mannitol/chloroaromatic compound transport system permease large subunit
MAVFYLKGVSSPPILRSESYWGVVPFLILQGAGLLMGLLFPETAMWPPKRLFGR